MKKNWNLISFIRRSDYRREIVKTLDRPMTPTELSYELGKHRSHVSRALGELQDKNVVTLLNPEDSVGRLYDLTEDGTEIKYELEEGPSREDRK